MYSVIYWRANVLCKFLENYLKTNLRKTRYAPGTFTSFQKEILKTLLWKSLSSNLSLDSYNYQIYPNTSSKSFKMDDILRKGMLDIHRSKLTFIIMYIMNRYIELGSTNIDVVDRLEFIISFMLMVRLLFHIIFEK